MSDKIGYLIIIPIVVIVLWKWWDMSSTISKQADQIENYKNQVVVLQVDVQTEKSNVTKLSNTIAELNKSIKSIELKEQKAYKALLDYKKKSIEEKYSGDVLKLMQSDIWESTNCKDGLKLNKSISELKYEDL